MNVGGFEDCRQAPFLSEAQNRSRKGDGRLCHWRNFEVGGVKLDEGE